MRRAERQRAAAPNIEALIQAGLLSWTPIGPQPGDAPDFGLVSGRVGAIAVDPTNADIVYLGGAQGGVWKTTDGGQNWTPLTDSQASLAIGAIAIDPSSCTPAPCKTIYVGTGEQTFSGSSYYGAGILKSTDAGVTWTQMGNPPGSPFVGPFGGGQTSFIFGGARISALAVKKDGSVILAGVDFAFGGSSNSGFYRSTDGGASWGLVGNNVGASGTDVLFSPDPARPGDAYAALGSPDGNGVNGVYKSTDSGLTWLRADTGTNKLPTTNVGRIRLAIAPSTLLASIASVSSDNLLGLFKSTDGGANWTQLFNTPNFCSGQCSYDMVVRIHPNNPNVIYVGGSAFEFGTSSARYFARSIDGGVSWQGTVGTGVSGVFIHVDLHALDFGFSGASAVRLYLGNDGGVWSLDVSDATSTSVTWVNLNSTLQLAQFYPGNSIHPSDEQIGMGGTQDNDTLKFSGLLPWLQVGPGCDGGYTVIDRAVPSTWYFSCQFGTFFKSVVNGAPNSARLVMDGINFADVVAFIAPIIGDPNIPDRLYTGTSRIYQTNDGAENWVAISPDLTGGVASLRAIAAAPGDSNVVYTGSRDSRIFRTVNASAGTSATWTEISSATELPGRVITAMAVSPADPNTAFVTFSGFTFGSDFKGHVFKTANGGTSWTDISGSGPGALPNTPSNAIVVDPDFVPAGDRIFVGTDVGVFETTDGGANWATLVTGLPRVAVLSLALRRESRTLRAGTHGRGAWDLQYSPLPAFTLAAVTPSSFTPNSGPANLTVRGNGFTSSSVIYWNGSPLSPTTFTSATQLDATVTNAELVGGPPAQVTVVDSVLGTTNALLVTVINLIPFITSFSPTSVASGSGALTLTVNGSNFVPTSEVHWDGALRPTTFVSSTQLTAQISAADTASSGKIQLTVTTPPPGGGRSNLTIFTVTGPGPVNDDFNGAITASPIPYTDTKNSGFATPNTGGRLDPVVPGSCTTGAASGGDANSIWYKFTPTSSGVVSADTIGSVYDTILVAVTGSPGAFAVVACNDDLPGQFAAPSQISFTANAGVTYLFMISDFFGDGGSTVFHLNEIVPPPNDNLANATVIFTSPFTDTVDTTAATTQAADPVVSTACAFGASNAGRANNIWYRFTPSANGTVSADTSGSDYDTILAAYTGIPGGFAEVACNDDSGGGLTSQISLPVTAATTYYLMVSAFSADGGPTTLHFSSTSSAGPDFNVSVSSQTITVIRGQPVTATLTITPVNGAFTTAITFSCTGLPSLSACSFNPPSVTPGSNPATVTMTITATAPSMIPPAPSFSVPPLLPWLVAALVMLTAAFASRRAMHRRVASAMAVVGLVILTVLLATCGGGGGGGSSPPPITNPSTPVGSYSVTVLGTAGGATQRFVTFTLTVQ